MNSVLPSIPPILTAPFAHGGDKALPPAMPTVFGRASLASGFPSECSKPLNAGGIPPDRLDINGALYMLSLFAFWQQSGGASGWNEKLDYVPTCWVWHKGRLYACRQGEEWPSGPGVAEVGAKEPGIEGNAKYWFDYAASFSSKSTLEQILIGAPIYLPTTTLPKNCLWADGSLVPFAQWPEFEAKYRSGGFAGMVLPSTATQAEIDLYKGKFVLSVDGSGVYLPRLGDVFVRGWTPGMTNGREAGSWQENELKSHAHRINVHDGAAADGSRVAESNGPSDAWTGTQATGGTETRPDNVAVPVTIYMGAPVAAPM